MSLSVALLALVIAFVLVWMVATKKVDLKPGRDRAIFEWLRRYRDRDPPFAATLVRERWVLLFHGALAVLGFWFMEVDVVVGAIFFGVGIGALGATIGSLAIGQRTFLAYRSVADWSKVEDQTSVEPMRSGRP
jgi:hypothetical protein